jgi:hypothetical protein
MARPDRPLLATARELGNITADDLADHAVRICARVLKPVKEVREPNGIGALRVGGAIALA